MNSTHGLVLTGTGATVAALTTLLTGWHGIDAAHAGAAAFLAFTGAAWISNALYTSRLGQWLWPRATQGEKA